MAEKIRPPHLPASSSASQQPLVATPSQAEGSQHGMTKAQQMPALQSNSPSQPDIALHARPASSSVTGTVTSCIDATVSTTHKCVTQLIDASSHDFSMFSFVFCMYVNVLCLFFCENLHCWFP